MLDLIAIVRNPDRKLPDFVNHPHPHHSTPHTNRSTNQPANPIYQPTQPNRSINQSDQPIQPNKSKQPTNMRCSILSILIWTISALAQTADTPQPSPTTASAIAAQISHTTPVASPTPLEAPPTTSQSTPETSTLESPPTATDSQINTGIFDIILTAPKTALPTSETSLATDTRELASELALSTSDDNSEAATTSQRQTTESSERTTTSAGVGSATETESTVSSAGAESGAKGARVGGDVAASACALFVAIMALTWAFADLD